MIAVADQQSWALPVNEDTLDTLVGRMGIESEPTKTPPTTGNVNGALEACKRYLDQVPGAVEGTTNPTGGQQALLACKHIAHFGLAGEQALEAFQHWNPKCSPPWTNQAEIDHKLAEGLKSAKAELDYPKHLKRREPTPKKNYAPVLDEQIVKSIVYERITAAELDVGNYELEYLIDQMLVGKQPHTLAGGKKCNKTNILCDAGISLTTGNPFLGKFAINRRVRVAIMTGESGMATIQETCRRICRAKEINLAAVEGLIFSPDLPRIADVNHQEALRRWLKRDDIEQLVIDPAYLVVPAGDNGNLFAQGEMLRNLTEVCADVGTGLILCHHTRKNLVDPFAPPELEDIAWAGFQEFARQWWLVSRRQKYEPGTGHHELWLNVGGSAGHSSLWALNINEGTPQDLGGRRWQVELTTAAEARKDSQERQQANKQQIRETKHAANVAAAREAIMAAFRSVPSNQETRSQIQERAGTKGAAFNEAFAVLLREGKLQPCTITRTNGQTYDGFQFQFREQG